MREKYLGGSLFGGLILIALDGEVVRHCRGAVGGAVKGEGDSVGWVAWLGRVGAWAGPFGWLRLAGPPGPAGGAFSLFFC